MQLSGLVLLFLGKKLMVGPVLGSRRAPLLSTNVVWRFNAFGKRPLLKCTYESPKNKI